MKEILLVILGIAVTIIGALVIKLFFKDKPKSSMAVVPQATEREQKALDKITNTVAERAAVEAKSEEQKKQVEEILAIKDPQEKLVRLAEQLKDL